MATDTLELGDFFDVRDMAKKARETADEFQYMDEVPENLRQVLLILNAGLKNFLTGEYSYEEPEIGTKGEEAANAWVEFGYDIAHSFERISNDGYTTFHAEDNVASVLAEQAEELDVFKKLPSYIENAINWTRVEEHLKSAGGFVEMYIDGETYVSNVYLYLEN